VVVVRSDVIVVAVEYAEAVDSVDTSVSVDVTKKSVSVLVVM
jgi:hypothetical protein